MKFALHRRGRPVGAAPRRLALTAAAIISLGSVAHATNWNELSFPGGDFSNDNLNPTPVSFTVGSNIVTGVTGGFDNDYMTFTIPIGEDLSSITVLNGSEAPDRIFFGIASGDTVVVDPSFTSAAGLLGWTLFSNAMVGADVLPALGLSAPPDFPPVPGATGFKPPLGPGVYTTWVLDGDGALGTAPYELNFAVSAVPEPGAWALLLGGIGGVGLMLRQARKTSGFRSRDAAPV